MKCLPSFIILFVSIIVFPQKMSILWKAEKDSTTIYLLGTNHLFPVDSILGKEKINHLINNSDIFFLELDEKQKEKEMDSIFNLRLDNNIKKNLGKKAYAIYKEFFSDKKYDNKLTPQEIALQIDKKQISVSCKHDGLVLMEDYFLNKIIENKKPIIAFEKISEQISQINNYYETSEKMRWEKNVKQLNYLKYYYNLGKGCRKDMDYINDNYTFHLEKVVSEENKQYWDYRNIKWFEKLDKFISVKKYKTFFIKVGIGHLDYSNGLIMLLKNKGFNLVPMSTINN